MMLKIIIIDLSSNVIKQTSLKLLVACLFFVSVFSTSSIFAGDLNDPDAIPHVGSRARESYISYLYATEHKAFAIGPGGAWAWRESLSSEEEAQRDAIEYCQRYTQQRCVTYALNNKLVFDVKQWTTLWGPYFTKSEARKLTEGNKRGQRFYDLAFKNENGKRLKLSNYRGKVIFLHFWGSWCPSCMMELPSLQRLQNMIKKNKNTNVEFIILQARESFSDSRQWADKNGFTDLMLYDSGADSGDNTNFELANGETIADREIARLFPSSYVIDTNGVVVFSHRGAVNNWLEYIELILDVANQAEQKILSKTD
ncbi:hypothetical protein MNBD_GAMMA25-1944 [hydrothermal vent metagenome]|uniref:Thioredoxin domain-containing protein n=1 Tax=hydrothermal vent metagenome TaxID=652676 RepID=A0A3B1BK40_9ZZZZ